jgi:hypothetical protein
MKAEGGSPYVRTPDIMHAVLLLATMSTTEQERFQELRQRELRGALTPEERRELAGTIEKIEQAEVLQLAPAAAALRRKRESAEAQNRELEALVRRKEALVRRMGTLLSELETERRGIREEEVRILAGAGSVGSGPAP